MGGERGKRRSAPPGRGEGRGRASEYSRQESETQEDRYLMCSGLIHLTWLGLKPTAGRNGWPDALRQMLQWHEKLIALAPSPTQPVLPHLQRPSSFSGSLFSNRFHQIDANTVRSRSQAGLEQRRNTHRPPEAETYPRAQEVSKQLVVGEVRVV